MIAGAWTCAAGILLVFVAALVADDPLAHRTRLPWYLLVAGACVCGVGLLVAWLNVAEVTA